MSLTLIRNIAAQPWLIDPDYAHQAAPFIVGLLNGNVQPWEQQQNVSLTYMLSSQQAATTPAGQNPPPGSVAVYKISGPLMKQDQTCGPKGMDSIAAELQEIDGNSNVVAVVLSIDSPGGTAAGTENLSRTVANMKKPVVAYVDGTMASAAYWIGSSAQHIMMGGNTAQAGSIGTMISMADVKPMLEKAGMKFHTVRATQSIHKNADLEQALQGSYDALRVNMLDPLNQEFTNTVKANRSTAINLEKENVLTGKMYFAKQAIKAGLADSTGSLADAINMALKLSKSPSKKLQMKINSAYPRISAVGNIENEAETLENGGVVLAEAEMQAIEAALTNANTDANNLAITATALTTLRQEHADLQATHQTVSRQLTDANNTIAQLQQQVQQLSAQTPAPVHPSRPIDPQPAQQTELPSLRFARERGIYTNP